MWHIVPSAGDGKCLFHSVGYGVVPTADAIAAGGQADHPHPITGKAYLRGEFIHGMLYKVIRNFADSSVAEGEAAMLGGRVDASPPPASFVPHVGPTPLWLSIVNLLADDKAKATRKHLNLTHAERSWLQLHTSARDPSAAPIPADLQAKLLQWYASHVDRAKDAGQEEIALLSCMLNVRIVVYQLDVTEMSSSPCPTVAPGDAAATAWLHDATAPMPKVIFARHTHESSWCTLSLHLDQFPMPACVRAGSEPTPVLPLAGVVTVMWSNSARHFDGLTFAAASTSPP